MQIPLVLVRVAHKFALVTLVKLAVMVLIVKVRLTSGHDFHFAKQVLD